MSYERWGGDNNSEWYVFWTAPYGDWLAVWHYDSEVYVKLDEVPDLVEQISTGDLNAVRRCSCEISAEQREILIAAMKDAYEDYRFEVDSQMGVPS